MLAKFVVDSHFKSQPKGANMDEKSVNESQDDFESALPADPEVLSVGPASSFVLGSFRFRLLNFLKRSLISDFRYFLKICLRSTLHMPN